MTTEEVMELLATLAAKFEEGGDAERDADEPGIPSSVYYHAAELIRNRITELSQSDS